MQIMVSQNPMHGLEYLPFDQAVRKGLHLLGGRGYLPNSEYRAFYRAGRITGDGLRRAIARVGPRSGATPDSHGRESRDHGRGRMAVARGVSD